MTREEALILYVLCTTYRALPGENDDRIRRIHQEAAAVLGFPAPQNHELIGDFIRELYKRVTP